MKLNKFAFVILGYGLLMANQQSWAGENKATAHMCGCYDTPAINEQQFIHEENGKVTIESYSTACKDDYFVTGITQTPEKNPVELGQFLIVSTMRCCKVCID